MNLLSGKPKIRPTVDSILFWRHQGFPVGLMLSSLTGLLYLPISSVLGSCFLLTVGPEGRSLDYSKFVVVCPYPQTSRTAPGTCQCQLTDGVHLYVPETQWEEVAGTYQVQLVSGSLRSRMGCAQLRNEP